MSLSQVNNKKRHTRAQTMCRGRLGSTCHTVLPSFFVAPVCRTLKSSMVIEYKMKMFKNIPMTQDTSFDVSWAFVVHPLCLALIVHRTRRSSYLLLVVLSSVVLFVCCRALCLSFTVPVVHCCVSRRLFNCKYINNKKGINKNLPWGRDASASRAPALQLISLRLIPNPNPSSKSLPRVSLSPLSMSLLLWLLLLWMLKFVDA